MNAFYIIATGALVSISTSLLGSLLLLRRMAMMGDAISHAILPGIVLAFLFVGTRNPVVMVLGASTIGLLSAFIIQFLNKKVGISTDAALGTTFTTLFALGIILISAYAGKVDIDQECVLFGEIAYVPFDLWMLDSGLVLGPRILYVNLITTALVVSMVLLCYRPWQLTTFDANYARALGVNVAHWDYLLMGLTSCVTVAAFEAVGAILVVAFLVIPPAMAYLLTQRLSHMFWLSCALGTGVSALGYSLAAWTNAAISSSMVMVGGLFLLGIVWMQHLRHKRTWPRAETTTPS